MMGARFEEHRAFRRLDVPAELKGLFHRLLVGGAGDSCGLGVEVDGKIGVLRHFADILVFREHRHPALDKRAVARGRHLKLVLDGVVHVGQGRWRKSLVLVALCHVHGRCHRELETGGRGLRVVVVVVGANKQGHHPVGLGCLDALDDLAELRYGQRDELFGDDLPPTSGMKALAQAAVSCPKL